MMFTGIGVSPMSRSRVRWMLAAFILSAATGYRAIPVNSAADPAARAKETEGLMTDSERLSLLHGFMAMNFPGAPSGPLPEGVPPMAGYVPGIPRLAVPALFESDGSLGVANIPEVMRKDDSATAFPSNQALAATYDHNLAFKVGMAMGREAHAKGINVLLAGGVNLARDPRAGRNFEYFGEDPLVSGSLGGALIAGVQTQHVVSTLKHFVMHDFATQEVTFNAQIDETALRDSDLLAFELALQAGNPGAVMCAYNSINGVPACANPWLLNTVLKQQWKFPGWVMSDWGSVKSDEYFNAGLDQASGLPFQSGGSLDSSLKTFFTNPIPNVRISDAVQRILRTLYRLRVGQSDERTSVDYFADGQIAREAATRGIVLLKNDRLLPLSQALGTVLVVGGHAQDGVLMGGGLIVEPTGHQKTTFTLGSADDIIMRQTYLGPSPVAALTHALGAKVTYNPGYDPDLVARLAKSVDVVIVFATRWQTQMEDAGSLSLPEGQDTLITKIAASNTNTVVVLETGNPVFMPWLNSVKAVLEAWYPGQIGSAAITDILTGTVNPSGHLPMTFPASTAQFARSDVDGLPGAVGPITNIRFDEGEIFGYRRLSIYPNEHPLFPFGYGLSYTSFQYSEFRLGVQRGHLTASVRVKNSGTRDGADVVQIYLVSALDRPDRRLAAFSRIWLAAGASKTVSVDIEPRILARWQEQGWQVSPGRYCLSVGINSQTMVQNAVVDLKRSELAIGPISTIPP